MSKQVDHTPEYLENVRRTCVARITDEIGELALAGEVEALNVATGLDFNDSLDFVLSSYSFEYFVDRYMFIYDTVQRAWIPFFLWDAQRRIARKFQGDKNVVVLKTRQVGVTWLALAYIIWDSIFNAPASALVISARDKDATYLLGVERLRGMIKHLPKHLQPPRLKDDEHTLLLGFEDEVSALRAVSTNAGDGYTNTTVVVDEADLHTDLDSILLSVEPTVNAGGKIIMISKSNRGKPLSTFKAIFKSAYTGNDPKWVADFIAWFEHPLRNQDWYNAQVSSAMSSVGHLEDVYESYPATVAEAISIRKSDRRIPSKALEGVWIEGLTPLRDKLPFDDDNLRVYYRPVLGRAYSIGVDCAEGLPTSDNSTMIVTDKLSGDTMAVYQGKLAPETQADLTHALSVWYNNAIVLFERNNHGHAFRVQAELNGTPLAGNPFDKRVGWLTNKVSKAYLYDAVVKIIKEGNCSIYDLNTYTELQSVERETLNAPAGMHDDLAIAFCLSQFARQYATFYDATMTTGYSINMKDW